MPGRLAAVAAARPPRAAAAIGAPPVAVAVAWDGARVWTFGGQPGQVFGRPVDDGAGVELPLVTATSAAGVGNTIVVTGADSRHRPGVVVGATSPEPKALAMPDASGGGAVSVWPVLAGDGRARAAVAWALGRTIGVAWVGADGLRPLATTSVDHDLDRLAVAVVGDDVVVAHSFRSTPGVGLSRHRGAGPIDSTAVTAERAPMLWAMGGTAPRVVWMSADHSRLRSRGETADGDWGPPVEVELPDVGYPTTAELLADGRLLAWVTSSPPDRERSAWAAALDLATGTIGEPLRLGTRASWLAGSSTGRGTATLLVGGPTPTVHDLLLVTPPGN